MKMFSFGKMPLITIGHALLLFYMSYGIALNIRLTLLPAIIVIVLLIWMKPIVGLYFCVISDLWLSGIQFYGANPRTFILMIIISSILASCILERGWEKEGKIDLSVLLPIFFILAWGLIVNIAIRQNPPSDYMRWAITFSTTLSIAVIMPYLINDIIKLKRFFYWTAFILSISAFFGILQFFIEEPFYSVRLFLGKEAISFDKAITRPPGLSLTYIHFSYELLSVFLLLIGLAAFYRTENRAEMIFLKIASIIVSIAILTNFTRSAIAGIIGGVVIILLLIKGGKKKLIAGFLTGMVLLSFAVKVSNINIEPYYRLIALQDTSAFGRLPRLLLGCTIVLKNPLGVGGSSGLHGERMKNLHVVGNMRGISTISSSAHNHFINIAAYYGLPGFLLYIWFLWRLVKMEQYLLWSSKEQFLKALAIGSVGFVIAYLFNSFFHNYGPIGGDNFFWYIVGMLLASYNIVSREKDRIQESKGLYYILETVE